MAFALVLTASSSPDKIVLYVEVNNIYKINNDTGQAELRLVQYVWWEWRDSLLIPVLNPYTKQKTGLSKQGSGFAVKDYVVVKNCYLKPKIIVQSHLVKTEQGWSCIYHDFQTKKTRHISFKWIITTHTFYDSELNNRDIILLEDRNKFIKR